VPSSTLPAAATGGAGAPAMGRATRDAFVVGGNRVPFARAHGAYADASNHDLLLAALDGLVARFGLQGERLGEVVAGAVLKHSRDFNLTREVVLGSALSPATPAFDVQQACATGLEAATIVAGKIRLGQIEAGIAGGTDTVSDAPVVVSDRLRHALIAAGAARSLPERLRILARLRPKDLAPSAPRTDEPRTGLSMGEHQAITTARWGVTREAQDELAMLSHHRLAQAWDEGFFDDLVTAYCGLDRDQNLRPDTSMERLAGLRTVFGNDLSGTPATMTAGSSTALSDGASTVLLSTREWATQRRLPLLARFVDSQSAAVDFVHGHEGLLMAPAHAVPALLERQGLTLQDFDFYELHEAFASTVLTTLAAWEDDEWCRAELGRPALGTIDRDRLNVHGSSLGAGHPFAATGGRILATASKLVAQKAQRTGEPARALISVCAAGGLGVAAIVESAPDDGTAHDGAPLDGGPTTKATTSMATSREEA